MSCRVRFGSDAAGEAEARWAEAVAPLVRVPDPELARFIVSVAVHDIIHEAEQIVLNYSIIRCSSQSWFDSSPRTSQGTDCPPPRAPGPDAELEAMNDALLAAAHEAIAKRGLRERVGVEHRLAHLVRRQGRRARYRGVRRNLFDLRRGLSHPEPRGHLAQGGVMRSLSTIRRPRPFSRLLAPNIRHAYLSSLSAMVATCFP